VAVAVPGQEDQLLSPKSDTWDFFFQRSDRSRPTPTPR
jgi:hypothetical protein